MPPNKEALNKDDLYLLLESYKNSVEMNTLISQQLTSISDSLTLSKSDLVVLDERVQKKLDRHSPRAPPVPARSGPRSGRPTTPSRCRGTP